MKENTTQKIERKIAYVHNGEVVFGVGYDLGYVDPYYEYQDDHDSYVRGSMHKFTYTTIDGEEKNILLPHVSPGVNWLDGAKKLFLAKVDKIVEAYKEKEIHIHYAHLVKYEDNTVKLDFNAGVWLSADRVFKGRIEREVCVKLERDEEELQERVNNFMRLNHSTFHVSSTDPSPFWYKGIIEMEQPKFMPHISLEFFVKGSDLYYKAVGEKNPAYKFSHVERHDYSHYKQGVIDSLIALGLGETGVYANI